MLLMPGMRMIWMVAVDVFVVAFVAAAAVGEEVVVVIVIAEAVKVAGDVVFAKGKYVGRLCLAVVHQGGERLVEERAVGGIDWGCGVREGMFVGIVVGR